MRMIRRSTWSPTTLLVLAAILTSLQLSEAGRSSIRVTDISRVLRGRSVDFRNNFLLPQNLLTSSNCSVHHLASDGLCGVVQPLVFPCSYDGPVIFQHLGCYAAYETVNLELVVSKNSGDITAEMFSIPISVENSDEEKPVVSLDRSTGTLSVAFMLTTGCTYTVVHDHSSLRLPVHGELSGETLGQSIPCGLSPRNQLAYTSRLNESQALDAVLVRVDRYNQQYLSNSTYYVLSLKTTSLPVVQLPNANMDVFELSETVISPSLLPLNQLNSYTFTDLNIVFPVLNIGSLYPIAAVNRGAMDAISFNAAQLQEWKVVFRPNETSTITKETFNYRVTDAVGRTIAEGVLRVTLHQRTGRTPSIRKNIGLVVKPGERTVLGPSHLSFYAMSSCDNATLRLVNDSSFGSFMFTNETSVKVNDRIPVSVINNSSLLYEHNAGIHRTILVDFSLWRLECSQHPNLMIPLLMSLLPTPSLCHRERHNSSAFAPSNIAIPLLIGQVENSSIMVSASSGMLLQSNCFQKPLSNHSRLPFIHSSDLNLTGCSPTSALKMRAHQASTVWFLPVHQSTTITINLRTNKVCSISELSIQMLNLTFEELFVPHKSDNRTSPSALLPTLINNNPLPLTSTDSVVITKQFLYIDPQGLLENKILFHLRTPPQNGHLCSVYTLQCTSSIPAFSQADIINQYIYYKPMNSILMNDSFEFTYSTYDIENSSLLMNFTIFVPARDLSHSSYRQFWAPFLGSKPLAPKFLRHITQQLKGNDIQFTVTSNPKHGWLQVPTLGTSSFHLKDSKNRNVVYYHNGTGECTDYITLTATSNGRTVTSNLTIAIRRNAKVPETLMGTKLLQDSNSFVLHKDQMNIHESFCPEYVMLEVVQLPGYGVLRYTDNDYKVTRLLQDNAMFSAADIKHGLVSYSLVPELIIRDNTTDAFRMKVTEPGQRVEKGDIPRSTSNVLSFDVIILPPEGSGEERTVNFTIDSPKWLVQLDNRRYGTIFNRNDFHEWNGEIQPYDIHIIVRQHPTHGKLKRRNNPVGEFTLEEVYQGLIRYESTLSHEDLSVTSDEFRFTVIFGGSSGQSLTIVKTFSLHWCYFYISKYKELLEESAEITKYTVRRTGQIHSQAMYVNFTTVSVPEADTATGQSDCRASAVITGDFCSVNERLDFTSRSKQTLSVRIYNDTIAEGPEQFSVKLTNPEGCLLPRQPPKPVWITDFEDYSTISFSIPQNRPANNRINRDTCKIEVPTKETVGVLNLNLTRAGNLNQTVGVICYTNTTLNNQAQSPDFISRPNNASSMVYFKPGEKHAKCPVVIVDDNLNEPTDSFFVHLGDKDGFAFIDHSSTPVCVIITHDERDLPLVQFTTTRITVQERKDRIVFAPFNISRTGADLNSITTVILEAQAPAPDNATAGLDFFAGPMDEIVFNHNEKIMTGMVRIRPDNIQEGKEVFHIHIKDNNNGRRGSPAVLEVVILDAFEDTVISFLSPNITFAESDGFIQIPFNRSGYKAVTSNITCVLTRGTALPNRDYYSLQSQLVTLAPGVSKGACNVLLKNDMIKEEKEYFTVTLHTNDLGAHLVTSKATVFITDIEDVPLVSFAQMEYIVEEPLSNYPVDYKQFTIFLTRAGDTNIPISVIMSTRPGTANEGIDYIAVNTTLHFPAGVNTVNTTALRVLANHRKQYNSEFYAVLKATQESESDVRLGNKGEAKIVINHWVLTGVFFPGLPMIASSNYSNHLNNTTFGTLLSHDNPLMCITPCDVQYPTSQLYLKECTRQGIDRSRTQFKWEISTDGNKFTELHQDTFLTSTHKQILDPVHLRKGLIVRCTATAVDSNGVSGYSRVSQPIKLTTKPQYHCQPGGTTATLSSYNGFQWRSQDLVMLTINLPHLPNTIPLVTSKPFALNDFTTFLTYPASRLHHTCSNFVLTPSTASQHSLLSHTRDSANNEQALYQHYDQTNCQWTFKTWISLAAVQQQCGAVLTENNLIVSLKVLYFSLYNNTAVIKSTTNTTAIFNHPELNNSRTVFPYVYRPIQPINDIHVKLISLQWESGQNSYSAIVYSYAPINRMIHSGILINSGRRRSATVSNMRLMYSDHQHGTQAWLLNIAAGSNEVMFNLLPCVHYSWSPGCNPGPPITFNIPLMLTSGTRSAASRARTAVDTTIIKQQQIVLVRLKLKAIQRLEANYTLTVTRAWVCSSSDISSTLRGGCLDSNHTEKLLNIVSDLHAQLNSNSTHMEILFSVDSLKQAGASDQWYVDIRHGVALRGQLVGDEDQVVLLVPPDQPQATSTAVLSFPTRSPQPGTLQNLETIPVYAIVLLSLAFGVLIVVCGITACFVCYSSRQRLLHKRKSNRPHSDDDDETSTSKVSNPSTTRPTMTNTHSRKIRRSKSSVQLLMQKAAEISRQNQTANSANNKPETSNSSLNRSNSLPDLATLRKSPTTNNTTAPPSYTLSTKITSRSKAKIATVRPISHVSPPSKPPAAPPSSTTCSKVTDKSLDVRLENWRKAHPCQPVSSGAGWYERHKSRQVALASYAQLYLAAGARTPEPGISPSTKL